MTAPELALANREAEQAVLGSIMIDNDALAEVLPILKPADFQLLANGTIFTEMINLYLAQTPIDALTLSAALDGHLQEIGDGKATGMPYLIGLMEAVPNSCYGAHYARVVADLAERRRLLVAGRQVTQLAMDRDRDLQEVRELAHGAIIATASATGREIQPLRQAAGPWLDEMERRIENPVELIGLETGFIDLDRMTSGLRPQQLIVIAGRPGMGKTALLLGMVNHMSVIHDRVGILFSLEMSTAELLLRLAARRLGIETQRLGRGELTDEERAKFYHVVGRLSEATLWIDDNPGLSVAEMRARSAKVQALNDGRLDYIMVDFMQLARCTGHSSRYEEVSAVARDLKNMAKALDVPVVAASQLSRAVEQRLDKRPQLSDLRDSGQIEEAANTVIFLYREAYYEPDSPRPNEAEVLVAKQREGPTGTTYLYWQGPTASYYNMRRESVSF